MVLGGTDLVGFNTVFILAFKDAAFEVFEEIFFDVFLDGEVLARECCPKLVGRRTGAVLFIKLSKFKAGFFSEAVTLTVTFLTESCKTALSSAKAHEMLNASTVRNREALRYIFYKCLPLMA
jgi:hypothetical protein